MSFHFNWIICLFIIGLWAFVIYSEYQSFAVICFANITTEDVAYLFIYLINDVLCAALSVARIPLLSSCFSPALSKQMGLQWLAPFYRWEAWGSEKSGACSGPSVSSVADPDPVQVFCAQTHPLSHQACGPQNGFWTSSISSTWILWEIQFLRLPKTMETEIWGDP